MSTTGQLSCGCRWMPNANILRMCASHTELVEAESVRCSSQANQPIRRRVRVLPHESGAPGGATPRSDVGLTPPASRLVGIELNPGPKTQSPGAAVAQLLPSVVNAIANIAKTKKKKSKKASNRSKKNGKQSNMAITGQSLAVARAPLSQGITSGAPQGIARMRVPVSSASLNIAHTGTSSTGVFQFANSTSGTVVAGGAEGTTPIVFQAQKLLTNVMVGIGNTPLSNLMRSFTKYRLRDIVITLEPLLPTSTPGSVCVAFIPDAGCLSGAAATYGRTATAKISARGPIWAPIVLRVPNSALDQATKAVDYEASLSDDDATFRSLAYGSLTAGYSGYEPTAGPRTVHVVSWTANLELYDLVDESLI